MSTAIIDADTIVHSELRAAEKNDAFGDAEVVSDALCGAHDTIEEWRKAAGCDDVLLVFSPRDRSNFRVSLLDIGYKDNRETEHDPIYWELENLIKVAYPWYSIRYLEGDDVLGLLHTSDRVKDSVAVSIDKDMKTLPGLLYNPNKMAEPVEITQHQADFFWMTQVLWGDAVDGYKGCPGIGEVKAPRLLSGAETLEEMWDVVYRTYLTYYDYPDVAYQAALDQARAARILRDGDYREGAVRLWTPDGQGDWHDLP